MIFGDGDVSVEFIEGKIDEIIVKGNLAKAAYSKDSLALLGLPVKDATFSNKQVMRWENIVGLWESLCIRQVMLCLLLL